MTENEAMALREEAESLPLHVQMCAMRNRQVLARLDRSDAMLGRIQAGVWAAAAAIAGMAGSIYVTGVAVLRHLGGH